MSRSFLIVALALIAYYRVLGLIAAGALVIYALYFFAILKLIPVVLTLPGIAGLILTIGVAADANIVIFERIKGKSGRQIDSGLHFNRLPEGFFDDCRCERSHSFDRVHPLYGRNGWCRGVRLTLGIGTIVSLFTAVVATHAILLSMKGSPVLKKRSALGAGSDKPHRKTNFVGASKWFFSVSGVILLVGGLSIANSGFHFGIDFVSGTRLQVPLSQQASVDDIRKIVQNQGQKSVEIQQVKGKSLGEHVYLVSTNQVSTDKAQKIVTALQSRYGAKGNYSEQTVGPIFGQTIAKSALIAVIASLIVISIYIAFRFQWKYAVPVLIALLHDILITAGVYSLTGRRRRPKRSLPC